MTAALLDVPRCLNVQASFVGPPRPLVSPTGERRNSWANTQPWGGTLAYRQHAVKECLDTAAIMRDYREPLQGETWLIPAESERRLLAQVNAIIGLGADALEQVAGLALDPDVPDPGRVFAALFVLGCVEGRDWTAPAQEIFVAAAMRNSAEASAAVEALSLCPNPEFTTVLASLLGHEKPRIRCCAIQALAFRGALNEEAWNDAMRDSDPTVVASALCAPLGGYDRAVCKRALQPLFASRDAEELVRLALRAGLCLRLGDAYNCAAYIVRGIPTWADALNCLSMFGHLPDARYIREVLCGPQPEDGLQAAFVLGSIELVPELLRLLDRSDLTQDTVVLARQAITAITGLPFDDTKDAEHAHKLWGQHKSGFELHLRYRDGRPLTLEAMLQSLRTGPGTRRVRQNTYLEMLAATASRIPRFSAYDFVRVQSESLRRIEDWLSRPPLSASAATNSN